MYRRRLRRTSVGAVAAGLLAATVFAGGTSESVNVTSGVPGEVPLGYRIVPRAVCLLEGERIDGRLRYWDVAGVIPAFRRGGTGVVLAPPAKDLPRLGKGPTPLEPFRDQWVLEPRLMASPLVAVPTPCAIQSFDPLKAVTLEQAGPHVWTQYDQRVHFIRVDANQAPVPQPCAANDPDFPDASGNIPPPPEIPGDEKVWAIDNFCNTTDVTALYVQSAARCPVGRGDMSRWPGNPYINQYDAGARLRLPIRFGYRGGNASGPSALLMAMLRSAGPRNLPTLRTVYDRTMQRPSTAVRPNQPNEFVARKAVAFLRRLGWRSAHVRSLGMTVEEIESQILHSLPRSGGEIVVSTAFGNARWGETGPGNLIVIFGADRRGNFIVKDPAGDYFASHKGGYVSRGGHYGPGSCGQGALYPHYWLLAYTTGRYLIELGRRTRPRP
jgi:hypothetical protein